MEEKKINNIKIANLSNEQQLKLKQAESELGCVLVAYRKQ